MNNTEQNKFERLASFFHQEKIDAKERYITRDESEFTGDADFLTIKKIVEVKELVCQASEYTSPDEAWKKVRSRISRRQLIRKIASWQIAAVVFAVALSIGLMARKNIVSYFTGPVQYISVDCPLGEVKNLTLADGTDVWLNSGTRLQYSNHFGKSNRHIIIDGEVLLKVKKDSTNPFTVSLGDSKVIVHGTTFNVRAYSADEKYEVVLIEGSVQYLNLQRNIFIEPGDRITEIRRSKNMMVDKVDTDKFISWTYGKVYFEDKTLYELVTVLEKWYDVKFEFNSDNSRSYKFTGMINLEQTLDYTLKIIEMTNKVKFVKKGGKMLITD